MEDCLFCKIAAGEIPSNKLFEDDKLLAFYDIDPQAPGPHLRGHCAAVQKAGRRRERLPRCDQCRRGRRPER